ncbi:putative tetratricopeptide-like helical domain superfamily [Dioscorea sansibarensis]
MHIVWRAFSLSLSAIERKPREIPWLTESELLLWLWSLWRQWNSMDDRRYDLLPITLVLSPPTLSLSLSLSRVGRRSHRRFSILIRGRQERAIGIKEPLGRGIKGRAMALVMEFRLKSMPHLPSRHYSFLIKRSDSKRSKPFDIVSLASKGKGFGREPAKQEKNKNVNLAKEIDTAASEVRKLAPEENKTRTREAPDLMSGIERKFSDVSDRCFNEKLEAVRRSALEQKKREENKIYQAIDYDAPIDSEQGTIGLGTKVGVGIAVVVFGLVFALGDFIPSGSVGPTRESSIVDKKLTDEEKAALQTRLRQYEATLSTTPSDPTALEGAAVTLVELGSYDRASSLLEKLTKERPNDAEAFRLLGEVKYEIKDYEGSAAAYRSSLSVKYGI